MRNAISENNKVTTVNIPMIPADVADAIEIAKLWGYVPDLVRNWDTAPTGSALRKISFDTLLTALVVGYERELTEEGRIAKEREEALNELADEYKRNIESLYGRTENIAYAAGIRRALNAVGVKLEGVTS